jgi:hypothetical protein
MQPARPGKVSATLRDKNQRFSAFQQESRSRVNNQIESIFTEEASR